MQRCLPLFVLASHEVTPFVIRVCTKPANWMSERSPLLKRLVVPNTLRSGLRSPKGLGSPTNSLHKLTPRTAQLLESHSLRWKSSMTKKRKHISVTENDDKEICWQPTSDPEMIRTKFLLLDSALADSKKSKKRLLPPTC